MKGWVGAAGCVAVGRRAPDVLFDLASSARCAAPDAAHVGALVRGVVSRDGQYLPPSILRFCQPAAGQVARRSVVGAAAHPAPDRPDQSFGQKQRLGGEGRPSMTMLLATVAADAKNM